MSSVAVVIGALRVSVEKECYWHTVRSFFKVAKKQKQKKNTKKNLFDQHLISSQFDSKDNEP